MKHLAILTNLLSPSSAPVYDALANTVPKVSVFLTGAEENRTWDIQDNWTFHIRRPFGLVFKRYIRGHGAKHFDTTYLHIPFGLFGELRRCRPDAVLSSEMGLRTLIAWVYCRLFRIPLVLHWEGTPHNQKRAGKLKTRIRKKVFITLPDMWVACGSESRRYLTELGVPKKDIFVSGYAVNSMFFSVPPAPSKVLTPRPVLLVVGRLVRLKGVQELLYAASELQREGTRFTILIVGEGDEQDVLMELVRSTSLQDVHFHPFVQPQDLPALYASADVLVFPSLCDGWGLVVGEAIASGLPVLSSVFAGASADLVPPSWQFNPLSHDDFVRALRMAITAGREGDGEFISPSQLPTPSSVAQVILHAFDAIK
ncbi:MAG: glycosyltransferase family 4 protein [Kiritimatiellae bacterium]|nr:glycosyltransferase family 4 protein [Kiritimatiellia bacterium]